MGNRLGSGAEDRALPSPCPFIWPLRRLGEGESSGAGGLESCRFLVTHGLRGRDASPALLTALPAAPTPLPGPSFPSLRTCRAPGCGSCPWPLLDVRLEFDLTRLPPSETAFGSGGPATFHGWTPDRTTDSDFRWPHWAAVGPGRRSRRRRVSTS